MTLDELDFFFLPKKVKSSWRNYIKRFMKYQMEHLAPTETCPKFVRLYHVNKGWPTVSLNIKIIA